MDRWTWHAPRNEFICKCGVGHYAGWLSNTEHGCCGCCGNATFPGRTPRVGDLAFCGKGILGLITSNTKQPVVYPDGNQAIAWVGMSVPMWQPWSSRNPCLLPTDTMVKLMKVKRRMQAFRMPHLHLKKYLVENWPSKLEYHDASEVRRFQKLFEEFLTMEVAP